MVKLSAMANAKDIITKCGGAQAVADMLGLNFSAVYRWVYRGFIPARRQSDLLNAARERGIDLTPDDFFPAPSSPPLGADTAPAS